MAGLGFVFFVLPPIVGMIVGILLFFVRRLQFLVAYVMCIPLLGATGGWIGLNSGVVLSHRYIYGSSTSWFSAHIYVVAFTAGYVFGMTVGAIVSFSVNRLVHSRR
jgi:Na+/H+-translocating membrane pyrophosphatase